MSLKKITLSIGSIQLLLLLYSCGKTAEVKFGNQIWMRDNLNVEVFSNGDTILEAQSQEEWNLAGANKTPAWCSYNSDSKNDTIYGKLYNWYAVNDSRKLAPKGWHVPSENETMKLREKLQFTTNQREKLISLGQQLILEEHKYDLNYIQGDLGYDLNYSPTGVYRSDVDFRISEYVYALFWTSTEAYDDEANSCEISARDDEHIMRRMPGQPLMKSWSDKKCFGFNVKCIKD